MGDPRMFTVKQCPPAYAAKSAGAIAAATGNRRDFFNSVGKVGDLQVLNDIGGGKIGSGLRTLASVSNSIRTGSGSLPTSIGSSLDSGANWVLETTGIAPTVVNALQDFHPGIANQAYGQAKSIFQQVQGGTFKPTDIPGYMSDLQNLERLGNNIFTPGSRDAQNNLTTRCTASPYAVDLIARAPKYKFLFVVQFVAEDGYSALGGNDFGPLDMAFAVKKSTRPNVRFQMEDVNYYNFRTKVITKTEFEEMQMSFHDDNLNLATEFYRAYLRAMSPITGLTTNEADLFEERGMDFVNHTLVDKEIIGAIPANTYSASSGPLAKDKKHVFREIILYHLFDFGKRMNVYRFIHPRITQLSLDELDMSIGNEGNELSLTFNYDSVYVDANVDIANNGGRYNLAQTQRGAVYPLRNSDGSQPKPTGSVLNPYSVNNIPTFDGGSGLNPIDNRSPSSGSSLLAMAGVNTDQLLGSTDLSNISSDSFGSMATPLSSVSSGGLPLDTPIVDGSFASSTSTVSGGVTVTTDTGSSSTQYSETVVTSGAQVAADPELSAKYSGNPNFKDTGNPKFSDTGSTTPSGDW